MRAEGRELLRGGLVERERFDRAAVCLPARRDRVHRGGLKPLVGPVGQALATRLLEAAQEVGKSRIAPGVAPEVEAQTVAKRVATDVLGKLLENRRALAVGDAVEDQEGDLRISGRARNRV